MDHSTRNLSVITLIVLAVFLGLNHIAQRAALADWGLVLVFLLLAVGIWFYDRVSRRGLDDSEAEDTLIEPISYEHHGDAIAIPESIQLAGPGESAAPMSAATPVQAAPVTRSAPQQGEPAAVEEAPPAPKTEQHPPTATPVTTTIEEKAATTPSAPAPETHPDIAAQSPAGAWSPSVPTPEQGSTAPVPTSVAGSAPEPVAPRTSTEKVPNIEPKEASAPAATAAKPDDLKVIEGIGPKMENALHAAGITTFAMLASASETQIRDAIAAAGMRFAPSVPTWAEQASFASKGDFAGLEAYQKTLVSGRKSK